MTSLLRTVKSRLFIRSRRHAFHQLDGQYSSRTRGRGSDFDDLREYAAGDDVRDIDWKATARSATTLLRRYHPERQHSVTFLVDTGRQFSAVSGSGERKSALAIATIGSLAYLVARHGDDVGMFFLGAAAIERIAPGRSDSHLERMLRAVERGSAAAAPSSQFPAVLARAAGALRRRGIVVCVSDEGALSADAVEALRALRSRHDVLWLGIGDTALVNRGVSAAGVVDVDSGWRVPAFLLGDRAVREASAEARARQRAANASVLHGLGIPNTVIDSEAAVLPALISTIGRGSSRG